MIEHWKYYKVTTPTSAPDFYSRYNTDIRKLKTFRPKPRKVSGVDFHSIEARYCDIEIVPTADDLENLLEKAGRFANTEFFDCVFEIKVNGNIQYYYMKDKNYIKKDNILKIKCENLIGLMLEFADREKIYDIDDDHSDNPTVLLKETIDGIFTSLTTYYNFNSGLYNSVINNFTSDDYYDIDEMVTTSPVLQNSYYNALFSGDCIYQEPDYPDVPYISRFKWIGEIEGYDDPVLILVYVKEIYQTTNIYKRISLTACFIIKNGQYLYLPDGNFEYRETLGPSQWFHYHIYSPPNSEDEFDLTDPTTCQISYNGFAAYQYILNDNLTLSITGEWGIEKISLKKNYDIENSGEETVARYTIRDLIRGLTVINNLTLVCDDKTQITIESKKAKSENPNLPIESDDVKDEDRTYQIVARKDFDNDCKIFAWGEGLAVGVEYIYEKYIQNEITDTRKIIVKKTTDGFFINFVTNGNFLDHDTNWHVGTNWTITNGHAEHSDGLAGAIWQTDVFEIGKTYVIQCKMENQDYNAKSDFGITLFAGDANSMEFYSDGYHSAILLATGTTLNILAGKHFRGWVDNISVYNVESFEIDILSNIEYDGKKFWVAGYNESNDNKLLELEIWEKAE